MSFSNTSLSSLTSQIWDQLRSNPVNWVLAGLCIYMVRAYFQRTPPTVPPPKQHRPRVFETFVPKTLVKYNGRHDPNLPIYLAIKGKVYDVTPGRTFYGPEGPYGNFAGHDASRGLAKGSFDLEMITPIDQPIDTLSDLTEEEWAALNDWEAHFANKYECIGELISPEEYERRFGKPAE